MRKLLKTLLPPFIGFAIYFLAIRFNPVYFTLRIDEMGEGKLRSFMAYYRYFLPLLFIVAVLTQLLIIVPVWDKVVSKGAKISSWVALVLICFAFAYGTSYAIWDEQTGTYHLKKLCLFMTGVQLAYWCVNLLVLYSLDHRSQQLPEVDKDAEE